MISATAFINAAMDAADRVPPIPYSEEMCDQFVRATVKRAGGDMGRDAGSNDMFRRAVTNVMPLDDAIRTKALKPGALLFIVDHDGKEPPQYRSDGLGNAWHVGIYTAGRHEVVHSSQSRGGVYPSTLKNGWTHAGWPKAVSDGPVNESTADTPVEPSGPMIGYINLPATSNVFHRINANKQSAWWGRINGQEQVEVVNINNGWARVRYGGRDGYVDAKFVLVGEPVDSPADPPDMPTTQNPVDRAALLAEQEALLTRLMAITKAMGDA